MRVLFSGGGTGGHINPAIAVARFIRARRPESLVVFAGAAGGMEEKLVPAEGFPLRTVELSGFTRSFTPKAILHNVGSVKKLLLSGEKAKRIVREVAPDVVVGTGGYASYPFVRAAYRLGIPTVIHESNALPGMSTKKLAKYATKILLGFPEAVEKLPVADRGRVLVTGNPLRAGMTVCDKAAARKKLGLEEGRRLVVSFWGSLGAREMNKIMADFMKRMADEGAPFLLVHSTGSFGHRWMPELVARLGVDLSKEKNIDMREYIQNMPDLMAAADLVLCRAGAMTSSELCATGTPAVIVPSPNVADNHQETNARALEARGAAVVILERELTANRLYDAVTGLLSDGTRLAAMSAHALDSAILDGDQRIYNAVVEAMRK